MKKYLLLIVLTGVLFLFNNSLAFGIQVGNDEISIKTPLNNSVVVGNQTINWFIKEADKPETDYQIDLFSGNCRSNGAYFGTIETGTKQVGSNGNSFSVNWNTKGPIQNKSEIADGSYCLRACALFLETPNNFYTLCDKRSLIIANTNRPPQITSSAPTETIEVGQVFRHQVTASDPDGDPLSFSISGATNLVIDSQTGLISSVNQFDSVLNFTYKVVVSDNKGSSASQSYSLNVVQPKIPNVDIAFVFPLKDDVVSKENNLLRWQIQTTAELSILNLFYKSETSQDWIKITEFETNPNEYQWDINEIESGNYILKLQYIDVSGNVYEKVSDVFVLATDSGEGELVPTIEVVSPKADSVINNTKPEIVFNIYATENAVLELEQIIVKINDVVLENCSLTGSSLTCNLETDLDYGKHKLFIEVTDSDEKKNISETFFEISETEENGETMPITIIDRLANLSSEVVTLLVVICCGGLLLIIIPWIIYLLISRRRNLNKNDNSTFIEQDNYIDDSFQNEFPDQQLVNDSVKSQNIVPEQNPLEPSNLSNNDYDPMLNDTSNDLDLSIGTQTISDDSNFESNDDFESSLQSEKIEPMEIPSIYDDEEIPDWLKDTGESSKPVSAEGSVIPNADKNASQPYNDYGLASQKTGDDK